MRIRGLLISVCMILTVSSLGIFAQNKDAIVAENFLQTKESVKVIAFVEQTLKEGDAAKLQLPVKRVLTAFQTQEGIANIEIIRENIQSLISITESMIAEQKYSDRFESEILLPRKAMTENLQRAANEEDDVKYVMEIPALLPNPKSLSIDLAIGRKGSSFWKEIYVTKPKPRKIFISPPNGLRNSMRRMLPLFVMICLKMQILIQRRSMWQV